MTNTKAFIFGAIYRPASDSSFYEHFDKVLEHVWVKYKNIVITGDFDCDLTQTESGIITSPLGNRLFNSLAQFNFAVVNKQATRITNTSSTLIDLIVTNNESLISKTRTLDVRISDHMLVYAEVRKKIRRPPPKIIRSRNFKSSMRETLYVTLNRLPGRFVLYLKILMTAIGHGRRFSMIYVTNMLCIGI
jgi:hypothetical protein